MTALHDLVCDRSVSDVDIENLREQYARIDGAVCDAFALDEERNPGIREFEDRVSSTSLPSWRGISLGHGFFPTPQGSVRFTISPQAREDVLDKLLALNHYWYRQEVEQGLHRTKKTRKKASAASKAQAIPALTLGDESASEVDVGDGLFPKPDALF